MKTMIIALLMAFLVIGCKGIKKTEVIGKTCDTVCVKVYVYDTLLLNKMNSEISFLKDSIKKIDSIITYENYMNARKIEKIKYYISITEKRPDNKKFFYGWIKRTVAEQ